MAVEAPHGSRSSPAAGREIGSMVVANVFVKSGSDICDGGKSDRVAVASVLDGTEVQWQWQVCWREQKFSGKCVGGNRSSVAVSIVLV